jgi:hypothetical protein
MEDLARLSNVELNDAHARAWRQHPDEPEHPRRVAIRAEMHRRTVAAGRTPGR